MFTITDTTLLTAEDECRLAVAIEVGVLAAAALAGRVARPPGATAEELAELVRAGRAAEHTFWMANLRLIKLVSLRVAAATGVPEEDLFQDGWIGLADAVQRFDHRRGVRFATYALPWIRSRITEAVRRQRHPLRVPASRDDEPPPQSVPLDELQHSGQDAHPGVVPFDRVEQVVVTWPDLRQQLSPKQVRVLGLRFGLDGGGPCSHEEVARRLGCSASTSRRLEDAALTSLRRVLSRRGVDAVPAARTAA